MPTLAIVLLAGLFLRELRRESVFDRFDKNLDKMQAGIQQLTVHDADQGSSLVKPADMYTAMNAFSRRATGICVFKHVSPFMFKKKVNFDAFLKPMIEHDAVSEVVFIINEDEAEIFDLYTKQRTDACEGGSKLAKPILADNPDGNGIIAFNCGLTEGFEALITFFSEPFMIKCGENWGPKFALHVLPESEVTSLISDNIRRYLTFS